MIHYLYCFMLRQGGARLQVFDDIWVNVMPSELGIILDYGTKYKLDPGWEVRIHPADQHLRYGPLSSVLFADAQKPPILRNFLKDKAFYGLMFSGHNSDRYMTGDAKTRSLFLLLVAESLIEEGL